MWQLDDLWPHRLVTHSLRKLLSCSLTRLPWHQGPSHPTPGLLVRMDFSSFFSFSPPPQGYSFFKCCLYPGGSHMQTSTPSLPSECLAQTDTHPWACPHGCPPPQVSQNNLFPAEISLPHTVKWPPSRTPSLSVFSSRDNHQTSHGPSGSCEGEACLCRVTHCWQPFTVAHINPQSKVLHPALLTPPRLPVHIFYFWNTSDLTHSSPPSGLMANPDHSGFYVSDESLSSMLSTW